MDWNSKTVWTFKDVKQIPCEWHGGVTSHTMGYIYILTTVGEQYGVIVCRIHDRQEHIPLGNFNTFEEAEQACLRFQAETPLERIGPGYCR